MRRKRRRRRRHRQTMKRPSRFSLPRLATKKSQRCVGVSAVRAKKSNEERGLAPQQGRHGVHRLRPRLHVPAWKRRPHSRVMPLGHLLGHCDRRVPVLPSGIDLRGRWRAAQAVRSRQLLPRQLSCSDPLPKRPVRQRHGADRRGVLGPVRAWVLL